MTKPNIADTPAITPATHALEEIRRGIEQIADALHTTPADVVDQVRAVTITAAARRPLIDAATAIHRTPRPDPQDVAAQVARIVTHCTVDGAPEWAEQAVTKLPREILGQLYAGARALVATLAKTCLCPDFVACPSNCPACYDLSPWSECRAAELRGDQPTGGAR